jgi:ribosome-binding factor A
MIKDEKGVERLKLDDPRVDWGDDKDFHNVETLKIGNVRVPDQYFHLVSDPAGFRGKRDIKHLKMVERLQKKERVLALKKKSTSSSAQTERPMRLNHQLRLSESIKNALNDILSNDIVEFPSSDSVPEEYNQDTIVNSALQKGSPQFVNISLTRDLKIAHCTWESLPNYETQVRDQLAIIKKQLRAMLAKRVKMRFVPKLVFIYNEKKVITQDVERLLNRIGDASLPQKPGEGDLSESIMKRGNLTQEDIDAKLAYYMKKIHHFQVTRQTVQSPFEARLEASINEKLARKEETKKLLHEKEKLKRTQSIKKQKEKVKLNAE